MDKIKDITFGKKAKDKLIEGVNTLADAVTITFGASGRTVILEDHYGNASVTKDGVSVARTIFLDDPIQNMGSKIVKESAEKTVGNCGDGTTVTILLAQYLINKGEKVVENREYNVFEVKRGVESAMNAVLKELDNKSVPVTDDKLVDIATIAANNDELLGVLIASAFIKAGDNGVVHIEESPSEKTYTTSVEGLEVQRGFVNRYFITDENKEKAVFENPLVLLVDNKIDNLEQIRPYLERSVNVKRPLFIVADVDDQVIATLVLNKVRGGLPICVIKPPHFGYKRKDLMSDLAISLNATVIDDSTGDNFQNLDWNFLGEADKIICDKAYTKFLTKDEYIKNVENQIKVLRKIKKEQETEDEKKFIDERIAKLAGKVEVIYVGGQTDIERNEKKDRVEDAVNATKASKEEGISSGGGVALFDISFSDLIMVMHNKSFNAGVLLLRQSLQNPLEKIVYNAVSDDDKVKEICSYIINYGDEDYGYDVKNFTYGNMFEMGIIDPTKVIKHSLINAVSVAMTILTTDCTVTNVKE